MSNWTHVAGIIRIDALRFFSPDDELDFDEIFGRECLFGSSLDIWKDVDKHPERYLPMGSEGSLQKSVWINPDISFAASYTVSIFGDLRNHDSADEIIDWFKKKCDEVYVRQAVITVENERYGTKTWTYEDEWSDAHEE